MRGDEAGGEDARWLNAAAALAERARPLSRPNPAVGAIIVRDGIVVGHGWTQPGGRPHAEAIALEQAGEQARGATLYVTLEPCAHESERGPACSMLTAEASLARVVIGTGDPDPRTAGCGIQALRNAGIEVAAAHDRAWHRTLAGYLSRQELGRPHVTLKLATSLDGCIALPSGESRWITGPESRAHVHRERARADAILVGSNTLRTDRPQLDVRIAGLEGRSPERWVLTRGETPAEWHALPAPEGVREMNTIQYLFVEGGAGAAASFLSADLVDRLMIYRAPILLGRGQPAIADLGLSGLGEAHGRWELIDRRQLGSDTLEVYERNRCSQA